MKKILGFIISLIIIFLSVGCMDDNTNSLPIYPDSSNSGPNMDGDSKEEETDSSTESEGDDSLENEGGPGEGDSSSSDENDNKPSNGDAGWSGTY